MQGVKSHACISGTQDMAHLTCSYYASQFDGLHVTLNYTKQHPRPSPVLMPEYEKVFMTMLLDNIFLKRKSIDRSSAPGMTGHTVTIYNTYKDLSKWIGLVDVVFDDDNVPTQFKQAPNNIGRVGIQEGRYTKGGPLPTVNPIRRVMPSSITLAKLGRAVTASTWQQTLRKYARQLIQGAG